MAVLVTGVLAVAVGCFLLIGTWHRRRGPGRDVRVPDQRSLREDDVDGAAALRPIGVTYADVTAGTDRFLTGLDGVANLRVFRNVRPPGGVRRVGHAVAVGPAVALVESVAWPPGRYSVEARGRVHCDGAYTGQRIAPLLRAAETMRPALPDGHELTAVVVVHRTSSGRYELPSSTPDLTWTYAEDLAVALRKRLRRPRGRLSSRTVAALADGGPGF
jgi:hypothetical protein